MTTQSQSSAKPNRRLPREPLGWPLMPLPAAGEIAYPALEESVRQSLRVILLTRPGELLMHPNFGAGLESFLHEPNTLMTRRRIHDRISDALNRWEPRILLDRVEVWEVEGEPDALRVEIAYRLKRTGRAAVMNLNLKLGE